MNTEQSKELGELIWYYFQQGGGGLGAENLMNKLLELDQSEVALRLLEIEAIEQISHRLGQIIEILSDNLPSR